MHHHQYLIHRPALWVDIPIAGLMLRNRVASGTGGVLVALSLGAVLHVALDSIAGRINWGWPLWDLNVTVVTVQATHSHWILSFLFHWTVLVELLICATAAVVWTRHRHRKTDHSIDIPTLADQKLP